jgi:hypothetical protein
VNAGYVKATGRANLGFPEGAIAFYCATKFRFARGPAGRSFFLPDEVSGALDEVGRYTGGGTKLPRGSRAENDIEESAE